MDNRLTVWRYKINGNLSESTKPYSSVFSLLCVSPLVREKFLCVKSLPYSLSSRWQRPSSDTNFKIPCDFLRACSEWVRRLRSDLGSLTKILRANQSVSPYSHASRPCWLNSISFSMLYLEAWLVWERQWAILLALLDCRRVVVSMRAVVGWLDLA